MFLYSYDNYKYVYKLYEITSYIAIYKINSNLKYSLFYFSLE